MSTVIPTNASRKDEKREKMRTKLISAPQGLFIFNIPFDFYSIFVSRWYSIRDCRNLKSKNHLMFSCLRLFTNSLCVQFLFRFDIFLLLSFFSFNFWLLFVLYLSVIKRRRCTLYTYGLPEGISRHIVH